MRLRFATLIFALALPFFAQAQDEPWPTQTVRLIAASGPGGNPDVLARLLAEKFTNTFSKPFIVENVPGAGGIVAANMVAKSPPDGHVLMFGDSGAMAINPALNPALGYDPIKDFAPITALVSLPTIFSGNPNVPAGTLAEFIALAKANPGKLNYASSGPGTPYHMAGELFKAMAGVDIVHVPYKESSAARTAVIGGQVEMMLDAVTTMAPQATAGKVRALGTSGKARSTVMPAVPTIAEAGVPGYETTIWLGVIAPKGTPAAIVNRLNAEIGRITARPDVRAEWAKQGAVAMTMTPDEFGKYLADDIVKWERVVKVSGAKPDQ